MDRQKDPKPKDLGRHLKDGSQKVLTVVLRLTTKVTWKSNRPAKGENRVNLLKRPWQQWPETRNSDRKLILAVCIYKIPDYEDNFRHFFQNKAISPKQLDGRQKFQMDGKYRG